MCGHAVTDMHRQLSWIVLSHGLNNSLCRLKHKVWLNPSECRQGNREAVRDKMQNSDGLLFTSERHRFQETWCKKQTRFSQRHPRLTWLQWHVTHTHTDTHTHIHTYTQYCTLRCTTYVHDDGFTAVNSIMRSEMHIWVLSYTAWSFRISQIWNQCSLHLSPSQGAAERSQV